MTQNNDTALEQLTEVLSFSEFARRHPMVFSSIELPTKFETHLPVCVDLQPAAWELDEPQFAVAAERLRRPGLIAAILEGGSAFIGSPRAIYRHLHDEARIQFWRSAVTVRDSLDVGFLLAKAGRKLRSVVA